MSGDECMDMTPDRGYARQKRKTNRSSGRDGARKKRTARSPRAEYDNEYDDGGYAPSDFPSTCSHFHSSLFASVAASPIEKDKGTAHETAVEPLANALLWELCRTTTRRGVAAVTSNTCHEELTPVALQMVNFTREHVLSLGPTSEMLIRFRTYEQQGGRCYFSFAIVVVVVVVVFVCEAVATLPISDTAQNHRLLETEEARAGPDDPTRRGWGVST